jgi:hypothetical protein
MQSSHSIRGFRRALPWAACFVFVSLTSCGSDDSGGSGATEFQCPNTTAAAPQACCDVANALIDACTRCKLGSRSGCVSQVTAAVKNGSPSGDGCAGADSIRDSTSLYNECLPAMETISCEDLKSATLPTSCEDQIQYII